MFAGLALASVLAAAPPAGPSPAALPYDDARFELILGGRATGRFLGSAVAGPTSFGGGISLGLGVRLWKGLYFEAGVAEGVYQNPAREAGEATTFRHFGPHPEPEPAAAVVEDSTASGAKPSPILAGQILLGIRYEVRTAKTLRLRPSVFVGLTHLHEATIHDFLEEPGKTLGGFGDGIRHRTGAQLGLGLRVPFPERWGRVAPRFSARFDADAAYYFDAQPGRLQAGLGAGVQVVF